MKDELRRMAMFGSGVAELTKHRAEQMVRDLIKSGSVAPTMAPAMVKDLLDRSMQNRKELTRFVRDEIKNQMENLGLATKRDFERLDRRVARLEDNLKKLRDSSSGTGALERSAASLERRVERLEEEVKKKPSTGTPVGGSPGTKPKSTAKKTTAKKTTAKSTAKKTASKRTTSSTPPSRATAEAITEAPAPRDIDEGQNS